MARTKLDSRKSRVSGKKPGRTPTGFKGSKFVKKSRKQLRTGEQVKKTRRTHRAGRMRNLRRAVRRYAGGDKRTAPLSYVIRIMREAAPENRMRSKAFWMVQDIVEQLMVRLVNQASMISISNGRERLKACDLSLGAELKWSDVSPQLQDLARQASESAYALSKGKATKPGDVFLPPHVSFIEHKRSHDTRQNNAHQPKVIGSLAKFA